MHYRKTFSLFINLSFLFLFSFYTISRYFNQSRYESSLHNPSDLTENCNDIQKVTDYKSKCLYVTSHSSCWNKGYLNYLEIFYCTCSTSPVLGFLVLLLWLLILFYILGNTTAEYFVPSIEGLSSVLNLSPTISGTTLLPFGNGANDVFASIISFNRRDGDVGINSVLGGALFITCFVVGILSILISSRRISINESSFIRDVLFFLLTLCSLLLIIIFGKVNFWFAVGFVLIYFIYIATVSLMQLSSSKKENLIHHHAFDEFEAPLLGYVDEENVLGDDGFYQKIQLKYGFLLDEKSVKEPRNIKWSILVYILELPLYLPRRLTIPMVTEENWSKAFATISSSLAPILLATLWNTQGGVRSEGVSLVIYLISIFVGLILGISVLSLTKKSGPPKRFIFPFLAGGFLMSITWTYIIVQELVSVLVAFGDILEISHSILGLTVLAWGNSMGDLISNLSLAIKGGVDGAQVAMSGCYAGPMFNTLVGLGLSLVFAAWDKYPDGYTIPGDTDLYETVGFLMMGLLWALVILPKRNMQLDKALGIGLLTIYLCFLFLRLVKSLGLLYL